MRLRVLGDGSLMVDFLVNAGLRSEESFFISRPPEIGIYGLLFLISRLGVYYIYLAVDFLEQDGGRRLGVPSLCTDCHLNHLFHPVLTPTLQCICFFPKSRASLGQLLQRRNV